MLRELRAAIENLKTDLFEAQRAYDRAVDACLLPGQEVFVAVAATVKEKRGSQVVVQWVDAAGNTTEATFEASDPLLNVIIGGE